MKAGFWEGSNTYMGSYVDFETARSAVSLATDVTLEGLLTRVDQLMRLQMAFGDEPLATVLKVADEGSLACMDPQMGLEVASLVELPQTLHIWTVERLLIAPLPHILVVAFIDSDAHRLYES